MWDEPEKFFSFYCFRTGPQLEGDYVNEGLVPQNGGNDLTIVKKKKTLPVHDGCSPESGHQVDGWRPSDNKGSVSRLSDGRSFGHLVHAGGEPELRDAHFILELEVAAGSGLGDEQQIIEEEQVPILTLEAAHKLDGRFHDKLPLLHVLGDGRGH